MQVFEAAFVASIRKIWAGGMGPSGPFQSLARKLPAAKRTSLSSFLEMSRRELLKGELKNEYLAGQACGLPGCDRVDSMQRCTACGIVAYCCKPHQLAHWKVHKVKCRAVRSSRNGKRRSEWLAETAIKFWRDIQIQITIHKIWHGK